MPVETPLFNEEVHGDASSSHRSNKSEGKPASACGDEPHSEQSGHDSDRKSEHEDSEEDAEIESNNL